MTAGLEAAQQSACSRSYKDLHSPLRLGSHLTPPGTNFTREFVRAVVKSFTLKLSCRFRLQTERPEAEGGQLVEFCMLTLTRDDDDILLFHGSDEGVFFL